MTNISDKVVHEIKTHILCSWIPPRKSWHLWDNVEKGGRARHITDGNTVRQ